MTACGEWRRRGGILRVAIGLLRETLSERAGAGGFFMSLGFGPMTRNRDLSLLIDNTN